jgi:hypothetical protein
MNTHTHTHTSGPRHLGRRAGNPAIYSQDGAEIAEILQGLTPEWRENARLIAAAPELLAAVQELAGMVEEMLPKAGPCKWGMLAVENARAAIAKVERGEG